MHGRFTLCHVCNSRWSCYGTCYLSSFYDISVLILSSLFLNHWAIVCFTRPHRVFDNVNSEWWKILAIVSELLVGRGDNIKTWLSFWNSNHLYNKWGFTLFWLGQVSLDYINYLCFNYRWLARSCFGVECQANVVIETYPIFICFNDVPCLLHFHKANSLSLYILKIYKYI